MRHPVLWTVGRSRLGGAAVVLAMVAIDLLGRGCCPAVRAHENDVPFAPDPLPGVDLAASCDYRVAFAVEAFVAEAAGPHRFAGSLRPDDAALVAGLGSPRYRDRVAATDAIAARGLGAVRLLAWAERSPDPEVRARALTLLDRLGLSERVD